ncbi:MAG: hypothetical protein KDK70_33590, partial [Myxococcales bacterium]|nr:hypothetical protein [Myxococcales bacterium]
MPPANRFQALSEFLQRVQRKVVPPESQARTGSFREREVYGLVERPMYAYGMLRAADVARFFGHERVTVCEFGVATGRGLRNMIALAEQIEPLTGIRFDIVGFDTGEGLPKLQGYKDHPELWVEGDFAMTNRDELIASLRGKARIEFGDISDTIGPFTQALGSVSPLGFISVDVDIYSGTVAALRCLEREPACYLPAVGVYLDDCMGYFANDWCGELAAVHEFNAAHELRKIGIDRSFNARPKPAPWHAQMYVLHVLDHAARQQPIRRESMS